MKKLLIKKLLNDNNTAILSKVKILFGWRKQLDKLILGLPQLHLSIIKYRQFLQGAIIEHLQANNLPINVNLILNKIDTILPISVGDYRSEKWEDFRLAGNTILQNLEVNDSIKFASSKYFEQVEFKAFNLILRNNKQILLTEPLTQNEINNLNKRVIFAMFGGIENIANIELIKYNPTPNCTCYENSYNNIQYGYLKISVKDENKVLKNKYLKDDWDMHWSYYHEYLKNDLLTYQLDSIYDSSSDNQYELIRDRLFANECLRNKYLLTINYCQKNESAIKELINSWKLELVDYEIKFKIDQQFFNEKVQLIIDCFKNKLIEIVELYSWLMGWQKSLYQMVGEVVKEIDANYEITSELIEEIFNNIYAEYDNNIKKTNERQFDLDNSNYDCEVLDLSNKSSTSSTVYNIKNK